MAAVGAVARSTGGLARSGQVSGLGKNHTQLYGAQGQRNFGIQGQSAAQKTPTLQAPQQPVTLKDQLALGMAKNTLDAKTGQKLFTGVYGKPSGKGKGGKGGLIGGLLATLGLGGAAVGLGFLGSGGGEGGSGEGGAGNAANASGEVASTLAQTVLQPPFIIASLVSCCMSCCLLLILVLVS